MDQVFQHIDDVEALLADLLPFAERMLSEHQEFLPFGGRIALDGEIIWEGADNGKDMPPSAELIALLHDEHRLLSTRRELRACAVLYDIRVLPPGRSTKQDAICATVDHVSGYSANRIYPYSFTAAGELAVEPFFEMTSTAPVFPRANA